MLLVAVICGDAVPAALQAADVPGPARSFAKVVEAVQPKIVKIHGAGGLRRLESYQSGFLISADGHVVTAFSYVLDTEEVTVTLDDGRRFTAELLGADPRVEIAVLKIDAEGLPHFPLQPAVEARTGDRILAFSNLFGVATGNEAASVMRGLVAARTNLSARSGAFETPYHGEVYVLDAITNNPGAQGGALTDDDGRLLGMLGKELRNSFNNTFVNYAIPTEVLSESVTDILAGKVVADEDDDRRKARRPLDLRQLGIVMVPDVLARTPSFIDAVKKGSPAAEAGLRPDDLIIFLDEQLIQSCARLSEELAYIESDAPIKLTVMRGDEMRQFTLQQPEKDEP